MHLHLPDSALVNKFVAKSRFYDRITLSTKLQNEFTGKVRRITWKYKLAEDTIGISKTESVTEIQIFEIELKQQVIPKHIVKIVDKSIPYPILYRFIYQDDFAFGITLKDKGKTPQTYFSDWNEEIRFDFTGIDLEKVYQKLVKAFISEAGKTQQRFEDAVALDSQIKSVEKEITTLQNKIKREKQFNRKVDLNKRLILKEEELKYITRKNQN